MAKQSGVEKADKKHRPRLNGNSEVKNDDNSKINDM